MNSCEYCGNETRRPRFCCCTHASLQWKKNHPESIKAYNKKYKRSIKNNKLNYII
jgi:hypothetical protein